MQDKISVWLLGDDRERSYEVKWLGTADVAEPIVPGWEDQAHDGLCQFALLLNQADEHAVYEHCIHGWTSLGTARVRDCEPYAGYPEMEQSRLDKAQ